MSPADRFKGWIDSLSDAWKDRLRGWMVSWATHSIVDALEDMEPEQKAAVEDVAKQLIDDPTTPPYLKKLLEQSTKKGNPLLIAVAVAVAVLMIVPLITGSFQPLGNLWNYLQERKIHSFRLDPITLTRIWLRDKPAYDKFFDDLKDQGWDDERIAIAKELSNIIPPLADMVRFADYSSFDPEVIAKWREFYDAPGWIREPFSLLGVTGEWADKYWFSHWVQPGRYELSLMHRRGLINDDDVKLAYRTMGYSPYWQDLLLNLVKEVPTRVDVRRWWDMRTIDEARLREIYHAQGYYGKDLEDYVLWTKVYVAFPDLIARWKNGFITLDEVRAELTGYGMPADRLEELIQTKMKATEGERTATERDLTKTEIYKGVKKGLITWGEGLEFLMDLGYDEDEANYILEVNVGVLEGSPSTYDEFKSLTKGWRRAAGMAVETATEQIRQAATKVVKFTKDLEILHARVKEEEAKLVKEEVLPAEATAKRDELRVSLHRAESALAAAKSHYDALVAEWRHKA